MDKQVFCTHCGKQMASAQPFCPHCGTPAEPLPALDPQRTVQFKSEDLPPMPNLQPAMATAGTGVGATPAGAFSGAAAQGVVAPAPRARRRARIYAPPIKRRGLVLGVSALLVLALVAITGYWTWGHSSAMSSKGVPKMLVVADEGANLQTYYLMGTSASDKVTLAEAANHVGPGGYGGSIQRVDPPLAQRQSRQYYAPGHILEKQQRILYSYQEEGSGTRLVSADLGGKDEVVLASDATGISAAVSDANGKVLVSETDENGKTRLSLTNLKGGPVVLAEDAVSASGWLSPDGTHVAYWIGDNRNNGTVTLADMNGTAIATLAKDARLENVVWSEDSSKLFISAVENDEIHTMMYDANGQNKQELARRGRLSEAAFVGGYAIYQIADNSGKWSLYVQQPGGDKRDLVRGADDLRWSVMPDQRSLVIYSKRQGRTSFRIEPVGGGDPIEIERGVDDAFWMVDSGRLIYVVENANSSSVESVTFDGKDKQEIGRGIDRLTSFDSRGGRVLLGVKENGEASVQYWDGKTLRKLAEGADAYSQVTFTPDGRAALYTDVYGDGPGNSSVYKVGLDGKQSDQLIEGAQIVHHGWY